MSTITINDKITIKLESNMTLLESMEQSGLVPEYNCRDGHCGACRCKLKSGETNYSGFPMAYTGPREILPCISKASDNIELIDVIYHVKEKRA
ncbi:class I ribonucleotide reductase maintenance protein YfaE [Vibrio sp.]|nr:class I ribonucleotide reductase maintenance protein YfaE [Vibrio sp.]